MQTVFNTQTNLPDYVDDKEVDGKTYVPLTDQKVDMVDTKGVSHSVIGSGVEAALDGGWKLNTSRAASFTAGEQDYKDKEHKQAVQDIVDRGDSAFSVGATHFVNEALMGVPDIVNQYTDTPEQKEAQEILDAKYPTAATIGGVGGFGTSLLYGGGIADAAGHAAERGVLGLGERGAEDLAGQAVKAGITKRVLASAAKDATIAGAYAAPGAVAQAAYGDPQAAGETMLWSLGIGGTLGAGLGLGKEIGGAALAAIGGEGGLAEKWANKLQNDRLGLSASDITNLGEKKVSNIMDQVDKVGETGNAMTPADFLKHRTDAWDAIEGHEKALDEGLSKLNSNPETAMPDLLKKEDIVNKITSTIESRYKALDSPLFSAEKKALDDAVEHINNPNIGTDGKLSFEDLFQTGRDISKGTKFGEAGHSSGANDVKKQIGKIYNDWAMNAAETVYSKSEDNTDKFADLLGQKKKYGAFADLLDKGTKIGDEQKFTQPGVLNSVLGNRVGGAVAIGTALSAVGVPHFLAYPAGYYALPLIKRLADAKLTGIAIRGLRKIADGEGAEFLGSMIAKSTTDAVAKHIDSIPDMLVNAAKVAPLAAINPIKSYLGDRSSGLSKDQQYDKVAKEITAAVANPAYATQEVGKIVSVFGDSPQLASIIAQKHFETIKYLYQSLPKNPNQPQPFDDREWKPTAQQKADFTNRLGIVENPMVAIHKLSNGTISSAELDTLKTVYPKIYGQMVDKIVSTGFAPNAPKLSYSQKVAVAKFTGVALDNSFQPKNTQKIQASFNYVPSDQNAAQGGPPTQTHSSKLKGPSMQTNTGRLSQGIGARSA